MLDREPNEESREERFGERSPAALLTCPWLSIRVQLALGAVFAGAALPKIADPPAFAHLVYNYRLVPGPALNAFALVLPWVELLAGLALLLGVWRRTTATLIGLMLVVFVTAIAVNLARDNAIDCGCFDLSAANRSHEERIRDMWFVIARDVAMLSMVVQILAASRVTDGGRPESR